MDFNQFGEGVTLYFPVYHPGALLFLGDGHAAQGDGELTGDALETSMEFSFTVNFSLSRWLADDYKLTPNEIAIVLGTAIQYQVAEVVDPLVHVVAKIEKKALAGLKP